MQSGAPMQFNPISGLMSWARRAGTWLGPKLTRGTDMEARLSQEKVRARVNSLFGKIWLLPYVDTVTGETSTMRDAYRMMIREPAIKAAVLSKLFAVASLDVSFRAGGKTNVDKRAAEFCKYQMEKLGGALAICEQCILPGLIDGYSVAEKVTDIEDRGDWKQKVVWQKIKSKDLEHLSIEVDEYNNVTGIVARAFNYGQVFDPSLFVQFTHLPLYSNPAGMSDFRAAYRAFWLIDTAWKLRAMALEKFSLPLMLGTYKNASQKSSLEEALENARGATWISIPEGAIVQAIELAQKSTGDFQQAIQDLYHECALSIAGAWLQSLEGSVQDGRGDTKVHQGTADLRNWHISAKVAEIINKQCVPDWIDMNFVGAAYPVGRLGMVDDKAAAASLVVDQGLLSMGLDLSKDELYDRYSRSQPTTDEDRLQAGGGGPGGMPPGAGPGAPPSGPDGEPPPEAPLPFSEGAKQDKGIEKELVKIQTEAWQLKRSGDMETNPAPRRELDPIWKFAEDPRLDALAQAVLEQPIDEARWMALVDFAQEQRLTAADVNAALHNNPLGTRHEDWTRKQGEAWFFNKAKYLGSSDRWKFAEKKPSTDRFHWGKTLATTVPHVRIIGGSGSGKSTVAQALASETEGKLCIIDPVWRPGNWGGLPAVTVQSDGDYHDIEDAMKALMEEMKDRQTKLQGGQTEFERLTIIFDEVPDAVAELKSVGEFIRRVAQRGRHSNMHLFGIGQSERVGSWGLKGYGDASENFATIYLGNKAYEKDESLKGKKWAGVLEWEGETRSIDLTDVRKKAGRKIDKSRLFKLNGVRYAGKGPVPDEALSEQPAERFSDGWLSPNGEYEEVDTDHGDWLRTNHPELAVDIGHEDDERLYEKAWRKGWVRVQTVGRGTVYANAPQISSHQLKELTDWSIEHGYKEIVHDTNGYWTGAGHENFPGRKGLRVLWSENDRLAEERIHFSDTETFSERDVEAMLTAVVEDPFDRGGWEMLHDAANEARADEHIYDKKLWVNELDKKLQDGILARIADGKLPTNAWGVFLDRREQYILHKFADNGGRVHGLAEGFSEYDNPSLEQALRENVNDQAVRNALLDSYIESDMTYEAARERLYTMLDLIGIEGVLRSAGPVYDGGTEVSRQEIAAEWQEVGFDADSVYEWLGAGCWDPSIAAELKAIGFNPHSHVLVYRDHREGDPMYELCNGDIEFADVTHINRRGFGYAEDFLPHKDWQPGDDDSGPRDEPPRPKKPWRPDIYERDQDAREEDWCPQCDGMGEVMPDGRKIDDAIDDEEFLNGSTRMCPACMGLGTKHLWDYDLKLKRPSGERGGLEGFDEPGAAIDDSFAGGYQRPGSPDENYVGVRAWVAPSGDVKRFYGWGHTHASVAADLGLGHGVTPAMEAGWMRLAGDWVGGLHGENYHKPINGSQQQALIKLAQAEGFKAAYVNERTVWSESDQFAEPSSTFSNLWQAVSEGIPVAAEALADYLEEQRDPRAVEVRKELSSTPGLAGGAGSLYWAMTRPPEGWPGQKQFGWEKAVAYRGWSAEEYINYQKEVPWLRGWFASEANRQQFIEGWNEARALEWFAEKFEEADPEKDLDYKLADDAELPPWDGLVTEEDQIDFGDLELVGDYTRYENGQPVAHKVAIRHGKYTPSNRPGEVHDVFRFEAHGPGGHQNMPISYGSWEAERGVASREAEDYRRRMHQATAPPKAVPPKPKFEPKQDPEVFGVYKGPKVRAYADVKDAKGVFGIKDNNVWASLAGATDDATEVEMTGDKREMKVNVLRNDDKGNEVYNSERGFHIDKDGKPFIYNEAFFVAEDWQGLGIGLQVFGRQVEMARKLGFHYIDTHAAKHTGQFPGMQMMNGYATWPKFGYSARLLDFMPTRAVEEIQRYFNDDTIEDVLDIYEHEGGAKWWEKNGVDIPHARFDLSDGSRSMQVWQAYYKYKMEQAAKRRNP